MATGLQYKESLSIISGGYPGEGVGSNGVHQDWTDTDELSGKSTVTYFYHDSALFSDANSTLVELTITDSWTGTIDPDNTLRISVHTVINSIKRTRIGSPSTYDVSMFVRRNADGANIWTSGGCVSATTSATHATDIDLGTQTIVLAPGQSDVSVSSVYFRSNACGYDTASVPSQYVDEFSMGVSFRNVLPPDYIPGKVWDGSTWQSHNRATNGHVKIYNGSAWSGDLKTVNGGEASGDPPIIRHASDWKNMRKIGNES